MTMRFAAACSSDVSVFARALFARVPLNAANDNGGGIGGDRLLRATLRHFAEHGLSAAERARENAEQAFFDGQRDEYRWWLAICNALDRRMAAAVASHREASGPR